MTNEGLVEQLRVVFDACDTDGSGEISLKELANISRSHVGNEQVGQILEILNPGDESNDKIDFDQFYQKFVDFMNAESIPTDQSMKSRPLTNHSYQTYLGSSPNKRDQGVFNENLKRSFEKNLVSTPSGHKNEPIRRKVSQVKLTGRIPLVNTSSEDEAEDSFDRKIASSLSFAQPINIQTNLLNRGGCTRSTIRKTSVKSKSRRKSDSVKETLTKMYPTTSPSEASSLNSPFPSSPSSGRSGNSSPQVYDEDTNKEALVNLSTIRNEEEYDSPSSGLGSMKADLEEEINSSILLARKHGDERLEFEKQRHSDEMESLKRERDLERRNFLLKIEQFQDDQDRLEKEVRVLREKVNLINIEKEELEKQMFNFHAEQSTKQTEYTNEMEQKMQDRAVELLNTVQRLTERVQNQDHELAEAKEDNIVLRSQVKTLQEEKMKESKRFKIFGGSREQCTINEDEITDPQDIRVRLRNAEQELVDQKEVNNQLKEYVGEVLVSIMAKNPQILQKE